MAKTNKDHSIGEIKGKVSAIWQAPLKLTVRDELFGKAVYCFLNPDQEEIARQYWGKRVAVIGTITRDPDTGCPLHVRHVTGITLLEAVDADAYKKARGLMSWEPGDEPAEQIIRRMRDAG